jgi:dihydroorotate dehydrogenase electron transfer subunit
LGVITHSSLIHDKIITDNCAFVLRNRTTNLIFSFGHQGEKKLQNLSNHIYSIDNNKFRNVHIIIFRNSEELDKARHVNKAEVYKRSFFTSCDEICEKVLETHKDSREKITSNKRDQNKSFNKRTHLSGVHSVRIIDNLQVGKKDSNLFKLTFETEDPIDILPGQFVMISTHKKDDKFRSRTVNSLLKVKPNIHNGLQTSQISYLKRPFGIYRTLYKNFSEDYLSKLNMEMKLASLLYTIKPNRFEIVYKVLERGLGTKELTRLTKNDKVEILAPLGKVFNFRELIGEGIDEIHIVGGGVGIAPLIYLVQVLRSFGIAVKAFIGIEDLKSLRYRENRKESYRNTGRNAKIYIDDLKFFGLSGTSDIYVSFLCDTEEEQLKGINNVCKGSFITEPYSEYLQKHDHLKILTFACGPLPMMQKVHNITAQYPIKTYVLMEKRMACGIGVCFSCVCKTIENGVNHYSRVCVDGPIMESKQINWNE